MLHPARLAVRRRVVADGRALPREASLERAPHGAVETLDVLRVEITRRSQRMDARPPERLVDVDVPHSRNRSLVEERCLDRRAPPGEPLAERPRRETATEGLLPQARAEERLDVVWL